MSTSVIGDIMKMTLMTYLLFMTRVLYRFHYIREDLIVECEQKFMEVIR